MKNEQTKNLTQVFPVIALVVFAILATATLLIGFVQSSAFLQIQKQRILNEGIDACLKDSSYTSASTSAGITTVEPIAKDLQSCLTLKNIPQ